MIIFVRLLIVSVVPSILQVLARGLSLEPGFPFQDLAHRTPGYVGADLLALIREASLCAVNRSTNTHTQTDYM